MSTKSSLSYGKDYHLYQEIFDVSNVYLKLDGSKFEVTNNSVMVQIPIQVWRQMILDWSQRGWPEPEDNTEAKITEEWLNIPIFMRKNSDGEKNE